MENIILALAIILIFIIPVCIIIGFAIAKENNE